MMEELRVSNSVLARAANVTELHVRYMRNFADGWGPVDYLCEVLDREDLTPGRGYDPRYELEVGLDQELYDRIKSVAKGGSMTAVIVKTLEGYYED